MGFRFQAPWASRSRHTTPRARTHAQSTHKVKYVADVVQSVDRQFVDGCKNNRNKACARLFSRFVSLGGQNGDGRFLRTETRKQNDEFLSELGIEPNVGQALSDRHGFVGVGLKGDANA